MDFISIFKEKKFGFKGTAVLLFAFLMVFSISACGDKAKDKSGGIEVITSQSDGVLSEVDEGADIPEGHPTMTDEKLFTQMPNQDHSKLKSTKPVKVSDAIKAKFKSATIRVTDNSIGTKDDITVNVGEKIALADGFSIKVDLFLPDYSIYDDYIASKTDELNNPAVMVELYKDGKVIASGWVFEQMAQYNSYSHLRYAVALLPTK